MKQVNDNLYVLLTDIKSLYICNVRFLISVSYPIHKDCFDIPKEWNGSSCTAYRNMKTYTTSHHSVQR